MKTKYLKYTGLFYNLYAFLALILYEIDKISIFPILVGIIFVAGFLSFKAFASIFKNSDPQWLDFGILWSCAIIVSLHLVILLSESFKTQASGIILFFIIGLMILSFRLKMNSDLPIFLLLVLMITGLYKNTIF